MGIRRPKNERLDYVSFLSARQTDERLAKKVQSSLHVTESFINRLGLEKELQGHTGCVNCLEWNEKGTILASASDDQRFILWDPFRHRRINVFETGHYGNIFTVKFIPGTQDKTVVTGAGDCRIRIHDIERQETIGTCTCHTGRVKRIATAPDNPHLFWSAAEDGLILESDLRAPHTCTERSTNILVNFFPHMGILCEAKCLSINPFRSEQLAVGANDPYVRLYDRRMIRPAFVEYSPEGRPRSAWERIQYVSSRLPDNLSEGCVQYYIAGHLPQKMGDYRKAHKTVSCTYLTFSPSGTELLVNMGSEQIYLFDIHNRTPPVTYHSIKGGEKSHSNGKINENFHVYPNGSNSFKLIESLNSEANQSFEKKYYISAIRLYNKAVNICPTWATLYANRAAALMKRGWDGDVYAALRDCLTTLQLDPNHLKSHFRRAKCLLDLQCVDEAYKCLNDFITKFPEQSHSRAFEALYMDITAAWNALRQQEKQNDGADFKENAHLGPGKGNTSTSSPSASAQVDDTTPDKWFAKWHKAVSLREKKWRQNTYDYEARFCGHCNTTTDIKEANFFGRDGQFIVAGSDDGSFFIWERSTTNIVQVIRGDESIVNCLQPHPEACLLATSGIDPVVRLWSPLPQDGRTNDHAVLNLDDVASENQRRMNADPFEVMLMNMGFRVAAVSEEGANAGIVDNSDSTTVATESARSVNCTTN